MNKSGRSNSYPEKAIIFHTMFDMFDIYMSGFLKMVLKNCTPGLDFTEL